MNLTAKRDDDSDRVRRKGQVVCSQNVDSLPEETGEDEETGQTRLPPSFRLNIVNKALQRENDSYEWGIERGPGIRYRHPSDRKIEGSTTQKKIENDHNLLARWYCHSSRAPLIYLLVRLIAFY